MRDIITKINHHNQTATIQHMVTPLRGKAIKSKTISTPDLTLVAKKSPKAIAKIEGIAHRLPQEGRRHDVSAALCATITADRTSIHQLSGWGDVQRA